MLAGATSFVRSRSQTVFKKLAYRKKNSMADQNKKSSGILPIIFAGPSGVGKGTIIDLLKKDYPSKVGHSVSHTTRAPRPGEVDGIHYHFVTPDKFQELVDQNKFIETAYVHNNRYGTSFDAVKAVTSMGKLCLLDLDVQGCQSVRRVQFGAYLIFIAPPSMETLVERLRKRDTENEEQIAIRIATATKEMEFVNDKMFDKLIINDDLKQCYSQIKEIICEMEHGFLDVPEIKA